MRMTLLLLSRRVLSRGSLGKPSSRTMTLSDRSRLSNWFCSHGITAYTVSRELLQLHASCCTRVISCSSDSLYRCTYLVASASQSNVHVCKYCAKHTSVAPKFSMADSLCPVAHVTRLLNLTSFSPWPHRLANAYLEDRFHSP